MNEQHVAVALIFILVYVATIWPSWKLLARLLAKSTSSRRLTLSFWVEFLVYRLLIAAPYLILLILGQGFLPDIIDSVIIGLIVFGLVLSLIRIFLKNHIVRFLWILYGYTYDGLLHFYPYKKLIAQVTEMVRVQSHGGPVLEIGSGTGNVIVQLCQIIPTTAIVGVDMSPTMRRIAQKKLGSKPNVTLVEDDAVRFLSQQTNNSFETIVLQNSLYAISNRDELWRELRRVISQDGSIVISNSDRAGSSSIIKEHLQQDSFIKLLHPKLLLVGIIDMFISQLSQNGVFSFLSEEQVRDETQSIFDMSDVQRVYGDVNILFILTPR